jgi:CheY-like chemotaxis protein
MSLTRHVVVVESDARCEEVLKPGNYVVLAYTTTDAAYRAIARGNVDAVVVHVEETPDFDDRIALVRRLQREDATRNLPILVVITNRTDRTTAPRTERFGSVLIKLTTPDCAGVAETIAGILDEPRFT